MNRVNRRTVLSSEKKKREDGPGGDPGPPPALDPCAPEEFPPFLEPMIARPKGREMNWKGQESLLADTVPLTCYLLTELIHCSLHPIFFLLHISRIFACGALFRSFCYQFFSSVSIGNIAKLCC
jgi:hypothetical protein